MPHARSSAIVAAILGLLAVLLAPITPASAEVVKTESPLVVTIDTLTPGSIPRHGPVRVTGTVTNTDDTVWSDVIVYPFISSSPMTTLAELAGSASVPETTELGSRILTSASAYTAVGDLTPGQTVTYALTIPRKALLKDVAKPVAQGVYWFGTHALGSGPAGYDKIADGRARTFLPFVKASTTPVRAALIVPLRAQVVRTSDGSVAELDRWVRLLGDDGRLERLIEAGEATPFGHRLTWLVDPAVLDAVQQLANGNPPRSIGSTVVQDDTSPSPSPSAEPSPSQTPTPSAEQAEVTSLATAWLTRALALLRSSDVLGLPYGDLDLTATAHHGRSLYEPAHERSVAALQRLGIPATQVDAPASGLIDAVSLSLPAENTPVLVSDRALPETPDGPGPVVADADGAQLVVSSAAALDGGPGPGDRQAVVPLRQRLLAEAAVRALDPDHPPLLVKLGAAWSPTDPREFTSGLRAPWLDLTGLASVTAGQDGPTVSRSALSYTGEDDELPASRFDSASRLIESGQTLQRVLTDNDQIAGELTDEALTGISFLARGDVTDPAAAAERWVSEKLSQVQIQGPAAVTLSSDNGHFWATIENELDQPVTIALSATSDSSITISPTDPLELAPGDRSTLLLKATASQGGVHNVTLRVTDTDGTPLGAAVVVPIRAARVSGIIWLFIAVGAGLLFGAIGVRLFRRIRAS
ncbi:DUF6049 family protein [Nocardioides sp.]|uniref:DUF6049 family protein n=1 Tax=Nocardioides sp. TaxID=35761 RepID=UPI0039E27DC6